MNPAISEPPPQPAPNRWLLHRIDQAVIAGLCLFGLIALGIYWVWQGGLNGRLIEIDHADKHAVDFKVDVNAAEATELTTIPEIGPTLAQRIIDYRKRHGPFKEIEDLRHVRGIGPKTLERLKSYVLLPPNPPKASQPAQPGEPPAALQKNPDMAEASASP
jgi:competence protein ComEA